MVYYRVKYYVKLRTPVDTFLSYSLTATKYVLILLSLAILVRCLRSMLSDKYEPEVWAYIRLGREMLPVTHWENILGRSRSADVRIDRKGVGRVHAVLKRSDRGVWTIYDVFSRRGIWVNSVKVGPRGMNLDTGDVINLGGATVRFQDITTAKRQKLESQRTVPGRSVSPLGTLLELTVFELFLLLQHAMTAKEEYLASIALAFGMLLALEWACYLSMRLMGRSGFEVETLAFYLTSLGLSVAASSTPEDMYKQILLLTAAVVLFLLMGWWLRSLHRTTLMRTAVAVGALALLAVNVLASDAVFGARNWLEFGGYSFQPSELVKVAYLYVGASTLERLYRKNNLFVFIAFSAVCVIALALIGDFGTALIFFTCFLVISFMRSGSIATVLLAVAGAVMAGVLAVSMRPYIGQRFASWGHAWDDIYGAGFQQSRAMSAAAGGGLFGKGAGAGWIKQIFAANTDLVFTMVCEEQGLIIGLCAVLAVLAMAFFAVRSARRGRSAYYALAACGAVSMLMVQMALNVFGSVDMLPFTGVTFPFVSRGGTSLLSCWMLMAFLKGADTRRDASFVVRPVKEIEEYEVVYDAERDDYDYDDDGTEDEET